MKRDDASTADPAGADPAMPAGPDRADPPFDAPDLSGSTAFVTGTARGIGKRIALTLAEHGCNVVSTGETVEPGGELPGTIHATAEQCRERGVDAHAIRLDVRDAEAVEAAVAEAIDEFGEVDVVTKTPARSGWRPSRTCPPSGSTC